MNFFMTVRVTKIRFFAAALLFSIAYSLFIKRNENVFDVSVAILVIMNLLTVLLIVGIFHRIQSVNSRKSVGELKKGLVFSFILFVVLIIAVSLFIFSLGNYVLFLIKGWDTAGFMRNLFLRDIPGTFIYLSAGIFIASVIFFYNTWRQAVNREQRLREENLKYRYRNLKAQVNPHFLFNSLNMLSEMVYESPRKTDDYIRKLADIYRYILDNEETVLVPLSVELEFVGNYFCFQEERNGGKIILETDVKNPEKYEIVPVSLQILVENALKHNSASYEEPLKIRICMNDGYIAVTNAINSKNIAPGSLGTGLLNLGERMKLITGKEIVIHKKDNEFSVELPLMICDG